MAESRQIARREQQAPQQQQRQEGAQRGNLVAVTEAVRRVSPFHVYRTAEVKLSPNPDDGDCYSASFLGKAGKGRGAPDNLALLKNGILKLARAAGVTAVTEECRPLVFERDRIIYESVVAWRGPDGTVRKAKGSVEIDLHPDSPEMQQLREDCKTKRFWDKQAEEYVTKSVSAEVAEAKFRSEVARLKKFMLPMAESKSLNRAIRALLQLKQKYSPAEIARPFFVEVLEYSPDLADPDIRAAVLQQGAQAAAQLYGTAPSQPALPPPTPTPPAPAPEPEAAEVWDGPSEDEEPDYEYDPETGEVLNHEHDEAQLDIGDWLLGMDQAPSQEALDEVSGAARAAKEQLTAQQLEELRRAYATNRARLERELL